MAELSRQSGLSVPTIKYYLREGLLQRGRPTGVNQAMYDDTHLERLRLIRALVTIAGLPLNTVQSVVQAVDAEASVLEAMAVTQGALASDAGPVPHDEEAAQLLADLVETRGWVCYESSAAYSAAVQAIAELQAEGLSAVLEHLGDYAAAADTVGRHDLEFVANAETLEGRIRSVVMGSVLRRPLLNSLVQLAQQNYASQHFPRTALPQPDA